MSRFKIQHNLFILFFLGLLLLGLSPSAYSQAPFAIWRHPIAANSCGTLAVFTNQQCWLLTNAGASCLTACTTTAGFGGVHSDTVNYAGSGGTDSNCLSILTALSAGVGTVSVSIDARGCQASNANARRRGMLATTENSSSGTWRRACACLKSNDFTPDTIDWLDFSIQSSRQTLRNFLGTLSVEISAVAAVGTPSIYYKHNSGSWTPLSLLMSGTLSIVKNDQLQFRVEGVDGHSANISVRNLTTGGTTIDNVLGAAANYACSGHMEDGYCYVLAELGETCYTACQQQTGGGCVIAGINNVGVDQGNQNKCVSVANSLGYTGATGSMDSSLNHLVCGYTVANGHFWNASATTCNYYRSNFARVCACGSGAPTGPAMPFVHSTYNYYLGDVGESCDTVCAGGRGGCVAAGLTGPAGSNATCETILTGLEIAAPGGTGSESQSYGCSVRVSDGYLYRGTTVTCAGTKAGHRRACSCLN